jgi:hypothetical protein
MTSIYKEESMRSLRNVKKRGVVLLALLIAGGSVFAGAKRDVAPEPEAAKEPVVIMVAAVTQMDNLVKGGYIDTANTWAWRSCPGGSMSRRRPCCS